MALIPESEKTKHQFESLSEAKVHFIIVIFMTKLSLGSLLLFVEECGSGHGHPNPRFGGFTNRLLTLDSKVDNHGRYKEEKYL
ncbi:hypothetical protein PanWU01x14_300150 [Parasponia andersonii]|uniref:Transmembrane protein n=1 Tax=Parasponia andersonii TaxID=3476 RepID=A0A2P5AU46_PARAD|nr:hypothetical protein PanWU01x14_300150 [Parasponia andersonii]